MIEFLNRLFGRQPSGATAKERLRLVLMSDHLSLAPEMIEAMKRDLVDVVSRYVEVDRERIDVHFENQDKVLAMLANIPITGVNRGGPPSGNGNGKPDESAGVAVALPESHAALGEPRPSEVEASAPKPHASGPRRKRRKRSNGGGGQQASGTPAPAT